MVKEDRATRYVRWFRDHKVFSVLIAAGLVLGLLSPIVLVLTGVWRILAPAYGGSLELVEARIVDDPWEAGRLVGEEYPSLGDSAIWISSAGFDLVVMGASHARRVAHADSALWLPNFGLFPELALLDVLVRNDDADAAVITALEVRAERIGPGGTAFACLPLSMSAAYHVRLSSQKDNQVIRQAIAHRVGGRDVERFGLLIAHDKSGIGRFRVHVALVYNRGKRLEFPPKEFVFGAGCGTLGPQINTPIDVRQ